MSRIPYRIALLAAAAVIGAGPPAALSGELCVACSGPDAVYRCAPGGLPGAMATGDPRAQMLCITELAKQGGHASCGVRRKQDGACQGELKTVAAPRSEPTLEPGVPRAVPPPSSPDDPSVAPVPEPEASENVAAAPAEPGPLKKAGQAVSDAATSAGQSIESAGSAVGNAAKKSWNCVASMFKDC